MFASLSPKRVSTCDTRTSSIARRKLRPRGIIVRPTISWMVPDIIPGRKLPSRWRNTSVLLLQQTTSQMTGLTRIFEQVPPPRSTWPARIMCPNIKLTCKIGMRVGDFHIVDALRGVVDGDGKYNGRSGGASVRPY